MNDLINKIMIKRYYLIVEEADVMSILSVLNKSVPIGASLQLSTGNCGWLEKTKWYMHFSVTGKQWGKIKHDLKLKNFDILIDNSKMFGKTIYEKL